MNEFRATLAEHVRAGTATKIVLSRRRRDSIEPADRIVIRPVRLRTGDCYQFADRIGSKELHANLPPQQAAERIGQLFGPCFLDCHLFTSGGDYAAHMTADGSIHVTKTPPSHATVDSEHNRSKQRLIPEGVPCAFLVEIGVMTPDGRVRASQRKKFRQINRFLELIDDVVSSLPESGPVRVIDFGCGKSSLTFALHHLLTVVHGRDVEILGLDQNADVIRTCRGIAERLNLNGLEFRVGHIAELEMSSKVDLAVSLHACNTATDDALAKAVAWDADVILAVPCCQHELFDMIDAPQLEPLLAHGILRERFAALATDALRAEALEMAGYRTQVVEFIDMEHTAKNVLLRGVRRLDSELNAERAADRFQQFKEFLGIRRSYLEELFAAQFAKASSEIIPARSPNA